MTVIGGWRVIAEAVIPTITFLVGLNLSGDYFVPALIALGVTACAAILRALSHLPIKPALIGVVSMAASVFVAWKTGQAVNVFLISILKNVTYGSILLISIIVRWPLLGVMLGMIRGEKTHWRKGEQFKLTRTRYYQITWIWVFIFAARLSVQIPFYFADSVQWLALMKLALGMPADAIAAYFCWKLLCTLPKRKRVRQDQHLAEAGAKERVNS
ncbi:DUF3159 domain-containing protein [Arcanobacterium hippocoleae]|uniref:DUF3159 domain-containing protein n=1 Tax=Arcanobacterium hippocoleae TaxID=149017 RepID=UPI00333E2448